MFGTMQPHNSNDHILSTFLSLPETDSETPLTCSYSLGNVLVTLKIQELFYRGLKYFLTGIDGTHYGMSLS